MKIKKKDLKIPIGMWIIVGFCFLAAIFLIITAVISFVNLNLLAKLPRFNLHSSTIPNISVFFGILMLILAVLYFFIMLGLFKLQNWARITLIIMAVINVVGGILSLINKNYTSAINLTVNLIIGIYLLFNKKVRESFNKKIR